MDGHLGIFNHAHADSHEYTGESLHQIYLRSKCPGKWSMYLMNLLNRGCNTDVVAIRVFWELESLTP